MDKATYKLSFDLLVPSVQHNLRCYSGEGNLRAIECSFRVGDEIYSLSGVSEAKIRAKREDGTYVYNDCEIKGDKVLYTFTSGFMKTEGLVECQITLYNSDGALLASPSFNLEVLPLVYSDEILESTNDFSALTTAVGKAETAAELAEMMATDLLKTITKAEMLLVKTENAAESAEKISEELKTSVDKYLTDARRSLTNPPELIASGSVTSSKSDIRINFGEKIYGEVSVYITIPPSAAAQNWGFYTYFDNFWVLHTDHNSGNSKMSGILTDRYSFVRLNARYDGGHWVAESGNYWSNSDSAGWTANASLITRGKTAGQIRSYIESIRFVSDYNPSYSEGDSQIAFPAGTKWEIYGRREPEIAFREKSIEERLVTHIGTYELSGAADSLKIDTDKLTNTPLSLKNRIIAYIHIPPAGKDFGVYLYANDGVLAQITGAAWEVKNGTIALDAEYTGADFSVTWQRASDATIVPYITNAWGEGMLRTDLFGAENGTISSLELVPFNKGTNKLPSGTKITLYGIRV